MTSSRGTGGKVEKLELGDVIARLSRLVRSPEYQAEAKSVLAEMALDHECDWMGKGSGVPSRLVQLVARGEWRGRAFKVSDICKRVVRALTDSGTILCYGGQGTGKSVAAAYAMKRAGRGLWLSAPALARARKWPSRDRGDFALLSSANGAEFVVLDDVGLEDDGHAGALEQYLCSRYDRHKAITICTSNLSWSGFATRYGERVAARVSEAGIAIHAKVVLRPQKKEQ